MRIGNDIITILKILLNTTKAAPLQKVNLPFLYPPKPSI